MREEGGCAVCSAPSTQKCGKCKATFYCSKEHQGQDWKAHKKRDCFPVDILDGKLVATRDLKAGDIILKEMPLLTGPRTDDDGTYPICLECYRVVTSGYSCTKCRWPVCGPQCEKGTNHASFECPLFARNGIPPLNGTETVYYMGLILLRGLMLKTVRPKDYEKLLELDAKAKERKQSELDYGYYESLFQFVGDATNDPNGALNSKETMDYVMAAIQYSRKWNERVVTDCQVASYVYYKGSFPASSCVPNSMWFIQNDGELLLRASVDIKAGTVITNASVLMECGTMDRRNQLCLHLIDCECERCKDPTELGTYMSAIKCVKCSSGYLLMEDPLHQRKSAWKCNSCGALKTGEELLEITQEVQRKLEAIGTEFAHAQSIDLHLKRLNKEKAFLKQHEGKILHKNHYLLFRCKMGMGQRIPQLGPYIENEVVRMEWEEQHVTWVRECLDLANVFWPGYSRYRGQLLYNLQRGIFCLIFSEIENLGKGRRNPQYIQPRLLALRQTFKDILKMRKTVKTILGIEAEGMVERDHADEMDSEGVDFDTIRRVLRVPRGMEDVEFIPQPLD